MKSQIQSFVKFTLLTSACAILAISIGCTPRPAVQATPLPIPVTGGSLPATPKFPTKTSAATQTSLPTLVKPITRTPTLGVVERGFSAWCFPQGKTPAVGMPISALPAGALNSTIEKDLVKVLVPSSMCGFVYRFNQPFQRHTYVLVYEYNNPVPWLKGEVIPSKDDPNIGIVVFRHEQITNPNAWEAIYVFSLRAPLGQEISSNKVDIYKLKPARCKSGLLPDPVTLACPEETN